MYKYICIRLFYIKKIFYLMSKHINITLKTYLFNVNKTHLINVKNTFIIC